MKTTMNTMEAISIGTKVKISDMGYMGYIDEIIIPSPNTVIYKILYYHKATGTWNTVVLPHIAFTIFKEDKNNEKLSIGFM